MIELIDSDTIVFYMDGEKISLSFQDVLEALHEIDKGNIPFPNSGICRNLQELIPYYVSSHEIEGLVGILSSNWEHYSNEPRFPVPSTNKSRSARVMYRDAKLMWSKRSKYGLLRWKLLDHLIYELRSLKHKRELQKKISLVIQEANYLGFTVTVENVPVRPLSMGNTRTVIDLRRSRGNY